MMNLLFSFLLVFLLLLSITPSKSEEPTYYSCNNKTYVNTQILKNIDKLLPILVSGTIKNGFSTTSIGKNETLINGLAQCREDVPKDVCSSCIGNASKVIRDSTHCPTESEAVIMYDYCLLRYSPKNFFGEVVTFPGLVMFNTAKVKYDKQFNAALTALMANISSEAINPDQKKLLGKGECYLPSTRDTLYALVQCTRDLLDLNCNRCLTMAKENLDAACRNRPGCRVLFSSCYLRYEIYPFFYSLDTNGSVVQSYGKYESVVVPGKP